MYTANGETIVVVTDCIAKNSIIHVIVQANYYQAQVSQQE